MDFASVPQNTSGKPTTWAAMNRKEGGPTTTWDVATYGATGKAFIRVCCSICKTHGNLMPPETRHEWITEQRPNGPRRVQTAILPTPESMADEARAFRFVHCQ